MTPNGWLQIAFFFVLLLLAAKPMGLYMARVYERQKTLLDPVLGPVERLLYRITGVNPDAEMGWMEYGAAMLIFSCATLLLSYAIERLQHAIPLWNPQHLAAVEPYLAWNTAVSFTTNTNWQSYVPEQHDELSVADDRPRDAQLLVGGDWHGAGDRVHSRDFAARVEDAGKFLGGPDARDAMGASADLHCVFTGTGLAGRDSELQAVRHGDAGRAADGNHYWNRWKVCNDSSCNPDDCAGAAGQPGSDQDAGDQRRRVYECELGAPV
jgi:hypothetical protein